MCPKGATYLPVDCCFNELSLRVVVSNAYCVAYLFFMCSSSCVAYDASFSRLAIFDWPGNIDPKPGMSHYIN
jgi:hypothetical protein